MRKLELLSPAGDMEQLNMSVLYGADAVYLAGTSFGMRSFAGNFSPEALPKAVAFAHSHNVKVHVTVNTMPRNDEVARLPEYLEQLDDAGVDALIVADPGMFTLAREICPEIDIHVSTQANNTNYMTYQFWAKQGAKRVVAARELSLREIKEIKERIPEDLEVECFIHGAMCISYSGRCLLSNYFTGRDANQGACTHPCRWKYAVMEESRPGEYLPIEENERGTFIFNSKDLCMIEHIPEMVEAGIDSFKIEGRMKTALYVATVARTYRRAIDDYFESHQKYLDNMDWYKAEISKCTYRQFTTGFYFGKPTDEAQIYDNNTYVNEFIYLGIVEDVDADGAAHITQRNKFCVGDRIEIMKPDGSNVKVEVLGMKTDDGENVESAPHPQQSLHVQLTEKPSPFDLLRVENSH